MAACTPVVLLMGGIEAGGWIRLAGCWTSPRFSERPCLTKNKVDHFLWHLSMPCMGVCTYAHTCTHTPYDTPYDNPTNVLTAHILSAWSPDGVSASGGCVEALVGRAWLIKVIT